MFCGNLNGKEIHNRENVCIDIADSFCCTIESNNIVKQLYSNKIKKKSFYIITLKYISQGKINYLS